ncbi:DUF6233 domain-containing protein [Streptomyces avermitilis]|uniref:DUF6233 domain-containing protein n=1 Tax=Streptomyces avermitilis TaxID=33903 RepID=UPI003810FA5B
MDRRLSYPRTPARDRLPAHAGLESNIRTILPAIRLDLLRFLQRVQEQHLTQTPHWIAAEEDRTSAPRTSRRHGRTGWCYGARRWPAADRARWNCAHQGAAKGRPVGREEALRLLTDVGVKSCGMCNPDRELGLP